MPVLSLSSSPLTKFPADAQLLTSHNGKNAGVSAGCEEEEEEAALTSCQTIRQARRQGRACLFALLTHRHRVERRLRWGAKFKINLPPA